MISVSWVLVAVQVLATVVVATLVVAALAKQRGRRDEQRRRHDEDAVRPLVVATLAGEVVTDWPRRRRGRVADRLVLAALGTFRGEARRDLLAVLDARGVLTRARRDLTHWRAARRRRAADVVARTGLDDVVHLLRPLLCDRADHVRLAAARALGHVEAPDAATALLEAMDGRRAIAADVAAMALVAVGPAAVAPLTDALATGSTKARLVACRILGHVGALDAVPALERALADDDVRIRIEAATALGLIGSPTAVANLQRALAPVGPLPLRAAAAVALGRIGDPGSAEALAALVRETGYAVPHAAALALVGIGRSGRAALGELVLAGPPAAPHAAEALAVAALDDDLRRGSWS